MKYIVIVIILVLKILTVSVLAQSNAYNDSIRSLGYDYYKGINGKFMNREKGIALIREAANLGNEKALYNLGELYSRGIYVEKNDSLALSYFSKSAELGWADAMTECGLRYRNGIGTDPNYILAASYFQESATLGSPEGALYLGSLYEDGLGVEQNNAEAFKWVRFAAENNNEDAQAELATIYYLGKLGIMRDNDQALYWAKLAAEKNNARAQNLMGILVADSEPKKGLEYFKLSYEGGDFYGRRNYADALRDGMGGENNLDLAVDVYFSGINDQDPYCYFYQGKLFLDNDIKSLRVNGELLKEKEAKEFAKSLIISAAEQDFEEAITYCKSHNIKFSKK